MNKEKSSAGRIQWGRMLKKLSPYTIQKGFRYLKHYGPKEFWIRLHERFEPEEVPYGPWYEAYVPDEAALEKQRHHHFEYSPLISVAVPAYRTPEKFLVQMIDSLLAQTYGNWELCIANGSPEDGAMKKVLEEYTKKAVVSGSVNLQKIRGLQETQMRLLRWPGENLWDFWIMTICLHPMLFMRSSVRWMRTELLMRCIQMKIR